MPCIRLNLTYTITCGITIRSMTTTDRTHLLQTNRKCPILKIKIWFSLFFFVIKCYCRAGPIPFVTRPHQIVTTLHSWFSSYLKHMYAFRNNNQRRRRHHRNNMHLTVYLIACRVQCAHYLGQSKPIVYTQRSRTLFAYCWYVYVCVWAHLLSTCTCTIAHPLRIQYILYDTTHSCSECEIELKLHASIFCTRRSLQ